MFALVRDFARRRHVAEISVSENLVRRHSLAPLAARRGHHVFQRDLVISTAMWAEMAHELPSIVSALLAAGVRVAAIKGVSYAIHLYEVPAERPMLDADLLIEERADAVARDVLQRCGFDLLAGSPLHHASTWARGRLVIDLHRDILAAGRGRIDKTAIWSRVRPGWPPGASRLDPIDELIFHLVHMVRNRLCGPLIQVVDTARLLEQLDPDQLDQVTARARDWGIARSVVAALDFCRAILADDGEPRRTWFGPMLEDVLQARQPSLARKVLFDLATSGSVSQLAARVASSGLQRVAPAIERLRERM